MSERSYVIIGDGFMLQGTVDEERLYLMVRLLDRVSRELAAEKREQEIYDETLVNITDRQRQV